MFVGAGGRATFKAECNEAWVGMLSFIPDRLNPVDDEEWINGIKECQPSHKASAGQWGRAMFIAIKLRYKRV